MTFISPAQAHTPTTSHSPPPPILSRASSPAPARACRRLCFSDVSTPAHVYELQPPSPKRHALALLALTGDDEDVASLEMLKDSLVRQRTEGSLVQDMSDTDAGKEVEEAAPGDIRRCFSSHLPSSNAPLIGSPHSDHPIPSHSNDDLRFNLTDAAIPPLPAQTLTTYFDPHHHTDTAARAGYL